MSEFINIGSFVIQFINITVIIFVLNKFLFKPYLHYLQKEEKERKELEKAYIEMKYLKDEAKNDASIILMWAKNDSIAIKKQAEVIAKKEAEIIVSEAKDEATKIKVKWELDIRNEKKAMEEEMKSKILQIAIKLNEKLFTKNEANVNFIKKELENSSF